MSVKEIAMKMSLKSLPNLKEHCKNEETESEICRLLSDNNDAYQVLKYLEEKKISPKDIFQILNDFVGNAEIKKKLEQSLDVCWLKYKLFDLMNLTRQNPEDDQFRKDVSKYIENTSFPCSGFDGFLNKCFAQVGRELTSKEISKIKMNLVTFKSVQILFAGLFPPTSENPDKSIEEHLKDLLSDYDYFPNQSVRKELQKDIILAFLQCHPEARKILDNRSPFKKNLTKLTQLGLLQTKIKRQFNSEAPQAIKLLKEIQKSEGEKQREYALLCSIKAIIFGVDVLQLSRLIAKTNAVKKMIAGQDIIMLMGPTGSGKTTCALKLLGYSLKEASYNLMTTLVPVEQLAKEHKSFYTSPQAKSCTRYLSAATIPSNMYYKGTSPSKMKIMLCDGPGFGDSGGLEIDIANGVGVINALCQSNSVRIVLLLPYNSLVADRLSGAVNVSQTITDLFTDFQKISKSIVILFSKVTKKDQEMLPNMLKSKLIHLSTAEKATQNVEIMLKMIQHAAQNSQNYLDPLNGDYRSLLKQIMTYTPINDPQEQFKFGFAGTTRSSIDLFTRRYKIRIQEYLSKHRYIECSIQLKLLRKMSQILSSNSQLYKSYDQITRHVKNASQQSFNAFQHGLKGLGSETLSERKEAEMVTARRMVVQIQDCFEQFNLQLQTAQQVQELITAAKYQFEMEFCNFEECQSKDLFARIRSFSTLLCPQFTKLIILKMELEFANTYQQAKIALDAKDTKTLDQVLNKLSVIQSRVRMVSDSDNVDNMMAQLKELLQDEFQRCRREIQETLMSQHPLYQRDVKYCQQNLALLHSIKDSNLITKINPKREIGKLIKTYELHCKQLIQKFESKLLEVLDIKTDDYSPAITTSISALSVQAKHLQVLLSFEYSNVKGQYENMRETVLTKLESNAENICCYIREMKEKITIEVSLQTIKYGILILRKSCELLREKELQDKLRKTILEQWAHYLAQEKAALSHITLRLSNYKDNFTRIAKIYSKLRSYEKLSQLGIEFDVLIKELKLQFQKKLQEPFKEYLENQLPNLKDQTVSFSHYVVQKFNKFCLLAQLTEGLVSPSEYNRISIGESKLMQAMQAHLLKMKDSVQRFCEEEAGDISKHECIRQPLKVLVMIGEKQFAKSYVTNRLGVQVEDELAKVHNKLVDIHVKIEHLSEFANEKDVQLQMKLISYCRHYKTIQVIICFKERQRKIHFQQLEKRLTHKVDELLQNDAESARRLISNIKPSQILFQDVNDHYHQFITLKQVEKRAVIINQFKIIQEQLSKSLKTMKDTLSQDQTLIIDQVRMLECFENFQEALFLYKKLVQMYQNEQDKKTILIYNLIFEVGKRYVFFIEHNFEDVMQNLKYIKLSDAQKKIFGLKLFESTMFEMQCFCPRDKESLDIFQKLTSHAKKTKKRLMLAKESILGIQAANAKDDLTSGLLEYFNSLKQKMQQKYHNQTPSFTIDTQFYMYYANFANAITQDKKQIKIKLQRNFAKYFYKHLREFKEAPSKNIEEESRIKMEKMLEHLPNQLNRYKIEWDKALKSQNRENKAASTGQGTIEELYDIFLKNYSNKNEDSFLFQFLNKNYANNKQQMMNKMIETNAFTYRESSFFIQTSQSQFFIRRLRKEIKNSGEIVKAFLREHRRLKEEAANTEAKSERIKKTRQ